MNKLKFILIAILLYCLNLQGNENKDLPEIRFGFISYYDIFSNFKDAKESLRTWLEELGSKKGADLQAKMYDDVDELLNDYMNGEIDIVSLSFNDYFLRKEKIKQISNRYWSVSYNQNNEYKYCLVVRNDLDFDSYNDLKGKKIIMKEHESIGRIWIDYSTLRNVNKNFDDLTTSIKFESKESTSLLNIYFKKEDVALIQKETWDVMLELNPSIKNKVKLFSCSKIDFLPFIGFFSNKVDDLKSDIFFNTISKKEDKEMNSLFELFDFNLIYKLDNTNIEMVEKFYENYYNLKKKNN